ncbi:MAG TPA: phosphatase PAP2 family protein [Pirellulales bacterium]|nr:phosphatase PAP2 family protein [Pirellulales bacterium]
MIALPDRCPPQRAGTLFRFHLPADTYAVSAVLVFLISATLLLCWWRSFHVPAGDACRTAALVAVLLAGAAYYRGRGEESFVLCLGSLAQVVAFAASYLALMYVVATLAHPLVDARLAAFDDWCNLTAPAARQWAEAHPAIATLLAISYDTLLYQTALVVIVLGLGNDRRRLSAFVLAFMLAAIVAVGLFALLPAAGPFVTYGFAPSADQATYLDHFRSLRDGSRTAVDFRCAEGLITFPSFHVAWAILLTWAFRGRRSTFIAALLVNSLVIVSTMTTGWHYFADVLGGAGVAVGAIAFVAWLRSWRANENVA